MSEIQAVLNRLEANRKELEIQARKQEKLFSKIDRKFNTIVKRYLGK